MSEAVKHTPGPWTLSEETIRDGLRSKLVHGMPEGMLAVVRTEHQGRYYGDANANLIAAAPDLLKVCRTVLATLPHIGGSERSTFHLVKDLEAAISKAEGATS